MARKYRYENEEVKKAARRLRDRLYRAAKLGYVDKKFYTDYLDFMAASDVTVSDEIIEGINEVYKDMLIDRKERLAEMSQEEAYVDNLEYESYTPSQISAAYERLKSLIYNQPEYIEGVRNRKRTRNGKVYYSTETKTYLNTARGDLILELNMWEASIGEHDLGLLCLQNMDFIEKVEMVLAFGYHTWTVEYKDALNGLREHFNSLVYGENYE